MQTTIDGAGRVVIPKAMRDELGLGRGGTVAITVRDGRIEIEAALVAMRVAETDAGPVIESDAGLPSLGAEEVRARLERVRP